jgi:uncharacterized alpha-E superfamily protein
VLLSRVADALYWIGRYLERAEHIVRVVDVRLDLGIDRRLGSDRWNFDRLRASLQVPSGEGPDGPAALVEAFVFDVTNRNSVASCITQARENARQVREEISSDMWQQVNELFLRVRQACASAPSTRPHFLARLVIDGIHLFQGITDATMGHGEGWRYLQVGRFLERAGATALLLDAHFRDTPVAPGATGDRSSSVSLLRSCAALEAYCRCYTADLRLGRVAEFLLLDPEFPRSVRFAADRVETALQALARATARPAGGQAERLAGRLHASLDYGQVDEILEDPHTYLDGIGRHCAQIHTALYQTYVGYRIESALSA